MKKNTLKRLVRDEISSSIFFVKYGFLSKKHKDSKNHLLLTSKQKKHIRNLADKAIHIHDRRYNDVVGLTLFTGGMMALLPLLKAAAITAAGSAAGAAVGNAIGGAVKDKVTGPLIANIVNRVKQLVASKDKDETYVQAIIKGIKEDMDKLLSILKKEGGFIYQKIYGLYQKIRGVK